MNENLKEKIEEFINANKYLKTGSLSITMIIAGIIGLLVSSVFMPMISSLFAILANVGFGIGVFYFIDRYVLDHIDTIEEIKKNNISYALFILAIAIIIAASIMAT